MASIPSELLELNRWVLHDANKHPLQTNGEPASVSDPSTWRSYKEAESAYRNRHATGKHFKGIGFVFTQNDPYCGIDLDKCAKNGVIDPDAQVIIDALNSYTELSVSRTGAHVIVKAAKPGGRCRKDNIEVYDQKRYFIITGNVLQGRDAINERQAELDSLYEETFGEVIESNAEPVLVDELVLDSDREPPEDKLRDLLEDGEFTLLWEHRKKSIPSLSEYDFRLACCAIEANWSDQETADLLLTFRETYGDKEDRAKGLRDDYIPRTILAAKAKSGDTKVLSLLPFKVVKVKQYGDQESQISLVLDNGREIDMGTTDRYVSARMSQARLVECQLGLSLKALKRWNEIILALQPLMELVPTTTREDDARSYVDDYISGRISMPNAETEDDLKRLFGSGLHGIAASSKGRVYLRLSDMTRYARIHTGMPNINTRTVSRDLIRLGFESYKLSITEEGKRRQIRIWISKAGFIDADE